MPPSSAAALQTLNTFNTNRKSAQDITTQAQQQYGIPESNARLSTIRGLVGNLQSSVNAVDPSVTGRTTGSFVTEGQRQALVNKERTPILGQLGEQNNALGSEQQNFNSSAALASQLASSILGQDQTKYQSLLDQYNGAVAAEQEAERRREFEATLAEQRRQADAAARAASGGGYSIGGYGGGGGGGAAGGGGSIGNGAQQRADKGFNFVDGAGRGINAFQYAQGHSIPFRTLLQQMAAKGDGGAAAGLQFIGNDGGADPSKVRTQAQANLYHALTGRWVAVNKGPLPGLGSPAGVGAFAPSASLSSRGDPLGVLRGR